MKPIDSFLIDRPVSSSWLSRPGVEKSLLILVDLVALAAAFVLGAMASFSIRHVPADDSAVTWWQVQDPVRLQCFFILALLTIAAFWGKGHYTRRRPYSNEVREVLGISVILIFLDAALVFFGKWQFSRAALALTWTFAPMLLLALRAVTKLALIRMGAWLRPMVVVGWGENAIETARAFEDERLMGYVLLAFLVPQDRPRLDLALVDRFGRQVPSIRLSKKVDPVLDSLGNPHVVLALEQGGVDHYQDLIQDLGRRQRRIQVVPSMRGLPLYGMEVDHFFGHEVLLLTVRNNLARRLPRLVKRAFDIVVSTCALILGAPLLLWIAIRVAASGGPIFFGHKRQGQHNKTFPCYKFRTMAPNAEQLLQDVLANDPAAREEWERDFKLKNDPRITPIGKFLRKTSMDELPQLWNVLKGDMSLVGPRPVIRAELERYGNQVDYYFEAKPGITGLWQISGRNDITYDTRVYLDTWYVKNWSLFNDIVILLRTFKVIFRRDGAY
jgi:undecaprenyl-phosphate galactose phosphotransferase